MKNILIIHHGIGVGGGLIALLGLIDELKLKNNVKVFCVFDSEAVTYIKNTGVDVFLPYSINYKKYYSLFLHSEASYFNVASSIRMVKNLVTFFLNKYYFAQRELERLNFEYDIVYLNSTFISDWSRAAKNLNKKVIIHIREPLAKGLFGFRKNIIKRNVSKYCDWIIAISKDNSKRIGLLEKTTVIYDPIVSKNRADDKEILLQPQFIYFLYLGGSQRIKGFEQFVKSLPYLNENIKIFFLGGNHNYLESRLDKLFAIFDPFYWKVNSLENELIRSQRIINVGMVDDVFSYYNNCRGVISPFSKPHAALPILEAFFKSKPVIVSNIEGMNEIVNHTNGIFFNNKHPKKLADAINYMSIMSDFEYSEMCCNAKKTFQKLMQKNLSVQVIINKF
ncbi:MULTISPECIES: glycosyltransferase family 4 protein [Flavobacterium]|uniref:Glycosyltransferase family 4 protein n=1 Tax=Flavobacterium endoglycinae TaxID=2816357 RepID=A0ABX7QAA1_9FLAO|nr:MULTISPECIES: glycosyltransferase family 4 protein [Flavobacterium]QSW87458.1 glycosyltransferase family 4 protein [Flavobacterium endoglycinae]